MVLGGHTFLQFTVVLSDGVSGWSGVQVEYSLVGASVDTDATLMYSFLSDGLIGVGDGIYKEVSNTELSSTVSTHNVAGGYVAFALQSGSASPSVAFYMLLDGAAADVVLITVVIADDQTPAGVWTPGESFYGPTASPPAPAAAPAAASPPSASSSSPPPASQLAAPPTSLVRIAAPALPAPSLCPSQCVVCYTHLSIRCCGAHCRPL